VPAYTVVDLGTLGGPISQAYAINTAGQIVGNGPIRGTAAEPRSQHAFVWHASTGLQDLGPVVVSAINDQGRVVGYLAAPSGQPHAYVWDLGPGGLSGSQDLGTLPGHSSSMAASINNLDQVVGQSYTPGVVSNPGHAFFWQAGTGLQDLGTLPGGTSSWANVINNRGQVVGASDTASGQIHAFLWQASTGLQDLGTLPGFTSSVALGLNNQGQVVGWSYTSLGGPHHAFVWQAGMGMQDLDVLPGYDSSIAAGLNDQGQVVGWSSVSSGVPAPNHGFLWQSGTGLQDLGALPCDAGPYTDNSPAAINNKGQITGECNGHATLWQPAATGGPSTTMASMGPLPNAAGWDSAAR
jgi:probable HAF family extracellular repeat protein